MKPIISLKDLNIVYDLGKSNETHALTDVSLDIMPGEYVIFFGHLDAENLHCSTP